MLPASGSHGRAGEKEEVEMATIPMQRARRGRGSLRRIAVSLFAAATVMAVGVPAGAAPPPQASCSAHITLSPEGPPGGVQSQVKFDRFGAIVSHVARAPGSSFEECFPALLEVLP
jgi:hypothetical protein